MSQLWHIRFQRRADWNGGDRYDWRSYRDFMVWPLTFTSKDAAEDFMRDNITFKGLTGRKLSASACRCGSTYANYQGPPR